MFIVIVTMLAGCMSGGVQWKFIAMLKTQGVAVAIATQMSPQVVLLLNFMCEKRFTLGKHQ